MSQPNTPRFVVKWNNGAWKIFDQVEFRDVRMVGLQVDAIELAAEFNGRQAS